MRVNAYPGKCGNCKAPVAAGEGFYSGCVVCKSAACHRALGLGTAAPKRLNADGSIEMPFDAAALPILRGMPGARFDRKRGRWTVSLDQADRPRLLDLAGRLGLDVTPELRKIEQSAEELDAAERANVAGLYPFQREGAEFLARRKRALLADDMGLGKTVQTLVALPQGAMVLVVCPSAVKYVWRDECRKWRPDLTPVVLPRGRRHFRVPGRPGEIVVTNYEQLPASLLEIGTEGYSLDRVILVVDEAHAAKNYKAQRSKKIQAMATVCARTWFLTGTPLLSHPPDLYGVLSSGHMARDVFGGWKSFMACFNAYQGKYAIEWGSPRADVPERLRRVMLRRTKAEVLPDLPKKRYQTITVALDNKIALKELAAVAGDWEETLDAGILPDFSEMAAVRAGLAACRIAEMLEIVEQHEESSEPLLVFSAHRAPINELAKRPGWEAITGDTSPEDRARIVAEFQAGELRGVGLTIAAGGVGLTLTRASRVLFVDLDWTPALNWQAEDRACRIGQRADSVLIMRMVSDHPLDQRVQQLLEQKIALIAAAVERTAAYSSKSGPELREETDEEMTARRDALAAAEREAERAEAKERVAGFYAKRCAGSAEKPLTPERVKQIQRGLRLMAEVCDYAETKDGQGFNKPDAAIGHWLARAGLEDEKSLRLAETILRGYPRQLERMGVQL